MDEQARQAALDAISTKDAVHLVRSLVDIPSPTGDELACARFVQGYLQEDGVEAHLQEVEEGRGNVIGVVRGEGDGPTVMLNGHLDTSYSGNDEDDYPALGILRPNDRPQSFELDGGVYGLGAYNMKGGIAAAFLAVRALRRAGVRLRGHFMASGVSGESEKAAVRGTSRSYTGRRYRGSGAGARYLVTHWEPMDYAIICEPSSLYVVNSQSGYMFLKIVVWGQFSYLSTRSMRMGGVSAIEEAAEVVRALSQWGPEYTERNAFDTGLGIIEPSVTIGSIEAGWPFKPSYVPAVCHVYVDLRITPAMTATEAVGQVDARLRALAAERPGLKYDIEVYCSNVPSIVTPADSLLVRTAVEVVEQRLGFPTRPFPRGQGNPSNDSHVFRRHGIPAVKCGPANRTEPNAQEMARQHGLHVAVDDIVQAARFYVHMAFELCGRTRSELAALD